MPTVPLLGGFVAGGAAEFVSAPPINLEPVVFDGQNGVSEGQLRAPAGTTAFGTGPGVDRGGIVWNDVHLRVMGTKLVQVATTGTVTTLGDVGGSGPVTFDYGFDRVAVRSGTALYYWNGTTLTQVTDPDLGPVYDLIWSDGYFLTTDGTYIIATDLADPTSVNPLRYGSAEEDPDMVTGLIKFREEVYALGRHSIQAFQNAGTTGFPYQAVQGSTIPYGCVSASAKCIFAESIAFVGSARNEALKVYVAGDGTATTISNKALDDRLAQEANVTGIVLESRTYGDERRLYVHMEGESWCYYYKASRAAGKPIWTVLRSEGSYRIRNAVSHGNRLICGDLSSAALGVLDEDTITHFGQAVGWRFDTVFFYNQGAGGIITEAELIGLPGRAPLGDSSVIFLSFTDDGETWSMEKSRPLAKRGNRTLMPRWYPRRHMRNFVGMRFRGVGLSLPGFASLEVEAEALTV